MSTQWLAGRVLRFEGEASIGSDFVNDGTIGPLGAGPGSLRFSDNVSGIGSFSGDSIFEGSYSRGPAPRASRSATARPASTPAQR